MTRACDGWVGAGVVHFSAYQPQYELKGQYCTDIPKEGDTFLVVDLVDPALRSELVGMRVLKGTGSNESESQIVADFRPSTHPDGVLRGEVRLDEGMYTVIIVCGKAESDAAPAVSLAGTHDRLSEACEYHSSTLDRGAANCLARVQARTFEVAAELAGWLPCVRKK